MKTIWERPRSPAERIILAADVPDGAGLEKLLGTFSGSLRWVKIGSELFLSLGPQAVEYGRRRGWQVFLDLKFHDIPRTVAAATRTAVALGASMLTVHASGGAAMISAALEAADERAAILAVTVLTSLGDADLQELGLAGKTEAAVLRLAETALKAGAQGLVCSAREAAALRQRFGAEPLLVTPGIRPAGSPAGDQVRTATPAQALAAGADWLVVGRPLWAAPEPAAALHALLAELAAV